MKKTFVVLVTTTFKKWYEVEAESEEEARKEVTEDYLDDAIDTDDIETEVEIYK